MSARKTANAVFWTREACLDALHTWVAEHGRVPSENNDWRSAGYGRPSGRHTRRIFGSWIAFIREGGYEPRTAGCAPGLREPGETIYWTRDRIAAAMLDWLARTGAWPTVPQWRVRAPVGVRRPGFCTVIRVFGSWSAAKTYAGWDRACRGCGTTLPESAKASRMFCTRACQRATPPDVLAGRSKCGECGTELENCVLGCKSCHDRLRKRQRRALTSARRLAAVEPLPKTAPAAEAFAASTRGGEADAPAAEGRAAA